MLWYFKRHHYLVIWYGDGVHGGSGEVSKSTEYANHYGMIDQPEEGKSVNIDYFKPISDSHAETMVQKVLLDEKTFCSRNATKIS